MGFGDFMSGMQGGMSTMDELKNSRLRRKLYDQEITKGDMEFDAKDFDREKRNLPKIRRFNTSDTFIGKFGDMMDPVLSRFMERLGRSPEEATAAAESDAAVPAEDTGAAPSYYDEAIPLADGGLPNEWDFVDDAKRPDSKAARRPKLTEEEFARRRAAAKADLTGKADQIRPVEYASKANKATIDKVGADVAPKGAIPETAPKGRIGRAMARGKGVAKGGAALGASIGGIASVAENSLDANGKLEDYYRRFGRDPARAGDYRPVEHAIMRGAGFLQDMGQGVTSFIPGLNEALHVDDEANRTEAAPAPAPAAAAPAEAIPTASGPSNPRRYPGQGAAKKPVIPEAAAPAAEPNPLDGFDVTKVNAADVPNFSNNDWVQHRKDMMDSLIMHGMSYAEAWDKVDQQVVATQQRGFMHFGNQARALLGSGDLKGAATAVRAAFQYLPTTTDLQVGEYNGHLVAFGVDEDTGEQVGSPVVITPEFLDSALMNFSDRKAWQEHAQDNRKLDQADTELQQGSRRLDLMEEGLGIERENALTNRLDAIGGGLGGKGGLKESDFATARRQLENWAGMFGDAEGSDPALPAALMAIAEAQYKRQGGDLSQITFRLEEMLRSPGGAETIIAAARRLASGQ